MTQLLSGRAIKAIHSFIIARYGGFDGGANDDRLELALDRPRFLLNREPDVEVGRLAAELGLGLLRQEPFVHGNKRTSLAAMLTLLQLNGFGLNCSEPEEVTMVERFSEKRLSEIQWIAWVTQATVCLRAEYDAL